VNPNIGWLHEKHTASLAVGTYNEVADFLNTYITYLDTIGNIGCDNTFRVVGKTLNAFEVHFVDSKVFEVEGKDLTEWSNSIKGLGLEKSNDFMHNKLQLYVPNLQPHFDKIFADNIDATYRLSTSPDSDTIDTAHISVYLWDAQTVYEIVGPMSSLDDDSLLNFIEWKDDECPDSHTLPYSLSYIYSSYNRFTITVAAEKTWESNTGMSLPMAIQTTSPVSSFSSVQRTIDFMETITGTDFVYSTSNNGACQTATFTISDFMTSPVLKYVINNANEESSPSVADWEEEVLASHSDLLDDDHKGWDRYLDAHFGFSLTSGSYCDSEVALISDTLDDIGFKYALRVTPGGNGPAHYYIGSDGIRSLEVNARDCFIQDVTDLCGCESNNNAYVYTGTYECTGLVGNIFNAENE